ncbi:MAG: ABC transporter permease [Oscillospiraceae bacterium]|nr:ABC transporter permease [Oscillospiraceae bacterium]
MKYLSKFYVGLVYFFLYLPIAVLIFFSFNESKSRTIFTGFTTKWYEKLLTNDVIIGSVVNTLAVALIAGVIATVLGTAAAIGISAFNRRMKEIVMNVSYLPIINPDIITGVSLMLLFLFLRIELGYTTLILAHIAFNVPIVIFNVLPKIGQMDKNVYNAALDLGCNRRQAFFKVMLPEIMPGVAAGFLLSVTYSFDDFVVSYFTSGPTSQVLSVVIYSMTRLKVSPEINALSTIMFAVVLAILLAMNFFEARKEKRVQKRTGGGSWL